MKRTMAFTPSVATLVFSGTTLLCPQQPAQSAAPPMNLTEEQVNDANIQLMRQDIRSQRQKVVAANMVLYQDNTQLRPKFITEFEKVISHKRTAMFFQINRRVSMMIELQLASQVPLVKP